MYGIFTYNLPIFYHKKQPNVGKYTIHGWYGTADREILVKVGGGTMITVLSWVSMASLLVPKQVGMVSSIVEQHPFGGRKHANKKKCTSYIVGRCR